ncbi:MAG: ABC transporter ATP-binding protein [Phycisphaerales bacterium]|nr:ABC transporter ATP-binding protein [Phycisphaerales bacterium]
MHALKPIWKLMQGQRLRYASALVVLVLAAGVLYLVPLVPQVTIDRVLAPEHDTDGAGPGGWLLNLMGGEERVLANLWIPAIAIVGFTLLAGGLTYLRDRWAAGASEGIVRRVRDRLYDHLQRLPMRYYDTAESGDLVQRCTSDVETLRLFLSSHVIEIGRCAFMLLLPIPLMVMIDWRMALVSLVLVPVIAFFSAYYFFRIRSAFKEKDEAEGRLTASIQENLSGIRVVRAFARQDFERERFDKVNTEHRDLDNRLYVLMGRFWSTSDLLCLTQKGLVIGFGIYWLAEGSLGVGAFYFFLSVVTMFIFPVRMMGRVLTELGKAMVALGRLEEILELIEEDASDAPAIATGTPIRGEIEFRGVGCVHGTQRVLEDVSFRVEPGQTLALMGPSGSGKSTIINLLLRFYDASEGEILIDGRPIERYDRRELRRRIAVVMQEPFLYSKTIRDNLRIARPDAPDSVVTEATGLAAVHESIERFERGYDTVVGERGVTLSGGQRQRVAIARALLQDPPVLVLDDALSAVDMDTESAIIDALRQRRHERTSIVIAHRVSTVMHADTIVVLDKGRVVQTGDHRSLVDEPGLYRRLWKLQTAGDTTQDRKPTDNYTPDPDRTPDSDEVSAHG